MSSTFGMTWLVVSLALPGDGPQTFFTRHVAEVVTGPDHHAVAGAEVWWLPPGGLADEDARLVHARSLVPEEWMRRLGQHAVSDATGRVDLVGSSPGTIVVAWHDGMFARSDIPWLDLRDRGVTLELDDDSAQLVRIVDASGAPAAGLEVAAWCVERGICLNCGPRDDRIWSAESDANGMVALPHAAWFFRSGDESGHLGDRVHEVGLGFPTRLETRVGRKAARGDPPVIELVAPPTERLDLEFQRESGELFTAPLAVALAPFVADREPFEGAGQPFGTDLVRAGHLILPQVERGLPLCVPFAWNEEEEPLWIDVRVPGPAASGPAERRIVRANDHALRVRGRAIGADRRPWTGRKLIAGWAPTDPQYDDMSLRSEGDGFAGTRTGDDGRFSFHLWPRDPFPASYAGRRDALLAVSGEERDEGRAFGVPVRVEVVAAGGAAEVDVGDVVMAGPVLVASGRIVVAAGTIVDAAFVPQSRTELRIREVHEADTSDPAKEASVTADGEGRFELVEREFAGPLAIETGEPGWHVVGVRRKAGAPLDAPTVPIALGSQNLEVVIAPWGGLRGRILLPEGAKTTSVDFAILLNGVPELADSPAIERERRDHLELHPDGSFEIRGPAKRLSVVFHLGGKSAVEVASPEVVLPATGLVDEPALVVDLRSRAPGK